jgi:hypothetical protein
MIAATDIAPTPFEVWGWWAVGLIALGLIFARPLSTAITRARSARRPVRRRTGWVPLAAEHRAAMPGDLVAYRAERAEWAREAAARRAAVRAGELAAARERGHLLADERRRAHRAEAIAAAERRGEITGPSRSTIRRRVRDDLNGAQPC